MCILFLAAFILVLAGCASGGPTIDNARLAGLQNGRTTANANSIIFRFDSIGVLNSYDRTSCLTGCPPAKPATCAS